MEGILAVSAVAVLTVLCSSGCVLEQTRNLISIDATTFVSYEKVMAVDFSAVQASMEANGYSVKLYPQQWHPAGSAYDAGAEICRTSDFVLHVAAWSFSGSKTALVSGRYDASWGDFKTEKEVGAAKKYITNETDLIAGYLNLTVDWNTTKWSVSVTAPQ
jgi:outer membrane murein-binding lipoprotein Lpp